MNVKEAQQQVETRQTELATLLEQKESADQELQAVQDKRAAAVRRLAAGDGNQRKQILSLEEQGKPLKLRVEGLEGLISDAQTALEQAQADLKEAVAQEAYELQTYLAARRRQECEEICASIADRKDRIYQLWQELNRQAMELQLSRGRVRELAENGFACMHSGGAITSIDTLASDLASRRKRWFVALQGPH